MNVFSSLSNRIFLATALLAVLLISAAIYIVNRSVTRQAERELLRGLEEAARLVEEYRNILLDNFTRDTRFVADLPRLRAALDTQDAETVKGVAVEYQDQLGNPDLFAVADRRGRLLVKLGAPVPDDALMAAIRHTPAGQTTAFWQDGRGILLITSVPVPDPTQPEPLGTLSVGLNLGAPQAERFKIATDSEIAFGVNGAIQACTLPRDTWDALAPLLGSAGVHALTLNGTEYLAITRPLAGSSGQPQPMTVVLRSRTERLRFLRELHTQLGATAVLGVLIAILSSYAIARTVTRPLGTITTTMREMAASGDLSRRIPTPDARWQDEDAQLLATTFNSMTDSIQRFQRDATQRERLSSLGRLSTVIAHEIRNPLMIIKTSLRALRRDDARPEQVRRAAADIDEEITRLNRIVAEVLDFARPIKFELAPADLNALARDAVRAAEAATGRSGIQLALDPGLPTARTDAERLRQALVNIIGNAIQAVGDRDEAGGGVCVATSRMDGSRIAITVTDSGVGIAAADLPRVFDPYFTTRRTGTGIGLAISRNIIEGLGGGITVLSEPSRGTEVRIDLPLDAPTA